MTYDGNLAALDAYERRQADQERNAPICDECSERIVDDHYYLVYGDILCERCFERQVDEWRKDTSDYYAWNT